MLNHRPLSNWERERWSEIVHACTSRPGGVEFGPQAKAVVLGVARQLEEVEARVAELEAARANLATALQALAVWQAADQPRMDRPISPRELSAIKRFAAAALTADDKQAAEKWQKLARLDKALCRLDELKQAGWGGGLGFDGHIYGHDWVCTIGQMVEAVGETPLEAIEKALDKFVAALEAK